MTRPRGYGPGITLAGVALLAVLGTGNQFAMTLMATATTAAVLATLVVRPLRSIGVSLALALAFVTFTVGWWLVAPVWGWSYEHPARLVGVGVFPIGYGALIVAILLLGRPAVGERTTDLRIDAALLAAAAGVVIAEALAAPTGRLVQTVADHVVFLVIPVLLTVAVSLMVWVVAGGARRSPSAWLMLVGLSSALVADLGFVLTGGSYSPWIVAAWTGSYAIVGGGIAHPSFRAIPGQLRAHAARTERHAAPWASFTLAAVALATVGFVVVRGAGAPGIGPVSAGAAIAIIALVSWRLYLLLSEREGHLDQARHRALHDELTGLPNRALIRDRLAQAARESAESERPFAVIFLDLDGFKQVNDGWGHAAGDRLLIAVGERLLGAVRPQDSVGRYAGDEFVIVAPGLAPAMADAFVDRLRDDLVEPVAPDGVSIEASIGVAICDGIAEVDQMLHAADLAMYAAKQGAGSTVVEVAPRV